MTNNHASAPMSREEYLAGGGKLSSPANVTPRYRAELLRLMASFVDSELAGSAGFAAAINWAPGIKERIVASRMVLEKADHAERVLDLMTDFGTDKTRYQQVHQWAARVDRDAQLDACRQGADRRLSVFHYPLEGWLDAVVMNLLMGSASVIQLEEMARGSYSPLADVLRDIVPRERRHAELAFAGLINAVADNQQTLQASVAYWRPRVAATFGQDASASLERLLKMGLRHQSNETLRVRWQDKVTSLLTTLELE